MNNKPVSHIYPSAKGINEKLKQLYDANLIIGFFIHNADVSQDEWLNPLAAFLKSKGHTTIGITTPASAGKCDLSNAEIQCSLEISEIPHLKGIDVFIISDMDCRSAIFPATSKVLGCCHGLEPYPGETSLPYIDLGATLDGWLCSFPIPDKSRHLIDEFWTGFLNQNLSTRADDTFYIIPMGYPRMTVLAEAIKRSSCSTPDSILYAPVASWHIQEWGGKRIKEYGKEIIRTLLAEFPDMNVIFRPYRLDLELPEVREICDYFAADKRFILDASPGRAKSFARSAVLVNDFSRIAKSFSFSTLRMAINFQPWRVKEQKITNWPGGVSVYDFATLVSAIKDGITNAEAWKNKIRQNRDALVMPFENSFDEIADILPDFYNGKMRSEWISLKRVDLGTLNSDVELINKILKQPDYMKPYLAAYALVYAHPESKLLLAYAFHTGMSYFNKSHIILYYFIDKIASNLLCKEFNTKYYHEIEPNIVRELYQTSLHEMEKKKNIDGINLITNLLDSFNKNFSIP